jgi:hypothetical protein
MQDLDVPAYVRAQQKQNIKKTETLFEFRLFYYVATKNIIF